MKKKRQIVTQSEKISVEKGIEIVKVIRRKLEVLERAQAASTNERLLQF